MEHVTHKVPVIQLQRDGLFDFMRQTLEPVAVVSSQRDIQRDDILDLTMMHRAIPHRRTRRRESMQQRLAPFFIAAFEVRAVRLPETLR